MIAFGPTRLVADVPGSVLWLLEGNPIARRNLQSHAVAAGLDPSRLVFAPRLPQAGHLARHRMADLFLDTRTVNAPTTASDALWAGLPVLTCHGETVAGRGCASVLQAAGLSDLVGGLLDEYAAAAPRLAREPRQLAGLKARCGDAVRRSPLFDTATFVKDLELAFAKWLSTDWQHRLSACWIKLVSELGFSNLE